MTNRSLPIEDGARCECCGKTPAFDVMGDVLCHDCMFPDCQWAVTKSDCDNLQGASQRAAERTEAAEAECERLRNDFNNTYRELAELIDFDLRENDSHELLDAISKRLKKADTL